VSRDRGSATVEFLCIGVLVFVPLVYALVAASEVQRNAFAVTQAAREAGRAFSGAHDPADAEDRARRAVALALGDQGLDGGAELTYGAVGSGCSGGAATLEPGTDLEVCVVRRFRVPGVPGVLDAGRNTVRARYVVHLDDFRSAG
jgi:Flp pilus assembly protein TadG